MSHLMLICSCTLSSIVVSVGVGPDWIYISESRYFCLFHWYHWWTEKVLLKIFNWIEVWALTRPFRLLVLNLSSVVSPSSSSSSTLFHTVSGFLLRLLWIWLCQSCLNPHLFPSVKNLLNYKLFLLSLLKLFCVLYPQLWCNATKRANI